MAAPDPTALVQPPWPTHALQAALAAILPGTVLQWLAEVASTNTRLIERARAGDTSPCLLVAGHQSAGRGRQGRAWQSRPGASLTFSLALPLAPASWSGLSLAVGVALAEALDPPGANGAAPRLGLKWPNDLLLTDPQGPRKTGGVLIETVAAGGARIAVIGIGLNLLPQPVAALSQGYGCLHEIDPTLATAPAALARVAPPLLRALLAFARDGFAPVRAAYAARDLLAGRAVTTSLADPAAGIADGVDADGQLWLRTAAGRRPVSAGEVSVRLAAGEDPC